MHKGCAQPNLKFWLFINVNAITQQPTRAKKKRPKHYENK